MSVIIPLFLFYYFCSFFQRYFLFFSLKFFSTFLCSFFNDFLLFSFIFILLAVFYLHFFFISSLFPSFFLLHFLLFLLTALPIPCPLWTIGWQRLWENSFTKYLFFSFFQIPRDQPEVGLELLRLFSHYDEKN